ncbi:unnamed protein product, partial [Rotaria socialis]
TIKRWCQMILQSGSITLSSPPGGPRLARTKGNIRKVFQPDDVKPHSYHLTQLWCRDNFPSFIGKDRWPPNSPDLNPLDYSIWDELVNTINWNKVQSKTTLIQ